MKILPFIFFILISGSTISYCQEKCDYRYNVFTEKLRKNIKALEISPFELKKQYNKIGPCKKRKSDSKFCNDLVESLIQLNNIYCDYLNFGSVHNAQDSMLQAYYDKYRSTAYKEIFENYIQIISENNDGHNKLKYYCDIKNSSNDIQAPKGRPVATETGIPKDSISDCETDTSLVNHTDNTAKKIDSLNLQLQKDKELNGNYKLAIQDSNLSFSEIALGNDKIYLTADKSQYLEFCFVSKGSFNLGITPDQYSEVLNEAGVKAFELNVQDEVSNVSNRYIEISELFNISKYELSIEQYNLIVHGSTTPNSKPITNITEDELNILLEKLNSSFPKLLFDIPTEVEWEFAAKGASENFYISTNDYFNIDSLVIVDDTLGLRNIHFENQLCSWINACNMLGNAKELCYANHEYYITEFNKNTEFVGRGGSYIEDRFSARTTSRHPRTNIKSEDLGIRLIVKKKNIKK